MEGAPGVGDDGEANGSVDEVIGVAPVFSSLLYALCMVGDACMHAGDRQKKDKTRTGGTIRHQHQHQHGTQADE